MPSLLAGTDVVSICANLIRFNTTNYGPGHAEGESACIDYIDSLLDGTPFVRTRMDVTESRSNLIVRVDGNDPQAPAIICQGHVDVVPAEASTWSFDPFCGAIRDGYVLGRGAVDMKDFVAAMIRVLLTWSADGIRPLHTTYFAFLADEETDGAYGAMWLVKQHPELFAGARFAVGESGGMRTPWIDREGRPVNFYPIATAERGTAHLHIVAHGPAGHGSYARDDNAVVRLAQALTRLAEHRWPVHITTTMRGFLDVMLRIRGVTEQDFDYDTKAGFKRFIDALGPLGPIADRAFRVSSVPTMLKAGYKVNVIPEHADAMIDVRTLPGDEAKTLTTIDGLLGPHVTRSFIAHEPALESPLDTPLYRTICRTVQQIDPSAVPIPFCTGGGTDAKAFSHLGITSYGFSPSCSGRQGQRAQGAHGIDERVPIDSLRFAEEVLGRILL